MSDHKAQPKTAGKESSQEPKKTEAPAQPKAEKGHRMKITQMSLRDVEAALESVRNHMGGMHSHYAQALIARKEYLTQSGHTHRKAA